MLHAGDVINLSDNDAKTMECIRREMKNATVLMNQGAAQAEDVRDRVVKLARALYPELEEMHFDIEWETGLIRVLYPVKS